MNETEQPTDAPSALQIDREPATVGDASSNAPIGSSYVGIKDTPPPRPVEHESNTKSSKWETVFTVIAYMHILIVISFMLLVISTLFGGASGYILLFILPIIIIVVPLFGLIALFNLIAYPIFIYKNKPHGAKLGLGILSLILSAVICFYASMGMYQTMVVLPRLWSGINEQTQFQDEELPQEEIQQDELKKEPLGSEIAKDEAIALLKGCKLKEVDVDHQTDKESGYWGELSSTGVVLLQVQGVPDSISIADRLKSEIIPLAEQAQQNCEGLPHIIPTYTYDATM